jgi:uncharacterized protein YuzB (UPF0349 family)
MGSHENKRLDQQEERRAARCSFCRKGSNDAGTLIESPPSDGIIAYICKSCCGICMELFLTYGATLDMDNILEYFLYSNDIGLESDKLKPTTDKWLATLANMESEIVKLRHGLTDGYEHSCEEIGKRFGITPERVAEIDTAALAKLKEIGRGIGGAPGLSGSGA